MKTLAQHIADLENTRAAKAARMGAITQTSIDQERSLEHAEAEEFDTLSDDIEAVDADLVRLRRQEAVQVSRAQPVEPGTPRAPGRAPPIVTRERDEDFKAQNFTRLVIARAVAHMEGGRPSAVAEFRWGKQNPRLVEILRANEIQSGSTDTWGAELVQADTRYTGDFIEFLNAETVFNKLPLREVPADVMIKGQDGQAIGYWVGESKAIPVTVFDFMDVELSALKASALAVISKDLLRRSTPAAEALVRDGLVAAVAQRIDATFLSDVAAVVGVSPAGILNGIAPIGSHGSDGDAVRADIISLYAPFFAANNASGIWLVMNKSTAKRLQFMTTALGTPEFQGVSQDGGTLLGDRVATGDNVNPAHLIAIKPSDVWKIGDGGLEISISTDATIEMSSAPLGAADVPTGGTANPVSLFQTDSVGIKVVRSMNFAKRRAHAVQYIDDASYGSLSSA